MSKYTDSRAEGQVCQVFLSMQMPLRNKEQKISLSRATDAEKIILNMAIWETLYTESLTTRVVHGNKWIIIQF